MGLLEHTNVEQLVPYLNGLTAGTASVSTITEGSGSVRHRTKRLEE